MRDITRIWRDRVVRWHKSGRSAREFAEQEGINPGTLYSWSRRLGMKRSDQPQTSEREALPTLLPVVVVPTRPGAPAATAALEVILPDGTTVRVPPAFDEDTLARVVRALGSVR